MIPWRNFRRSSKSFAGERSSSLTCDPIPTFSMEKQKGDHLTHGALDHLARSIGALLQSYGTGGERALLLYPAGLEFIAAFFGCLYAGVIAVPLPPPHLAQPHRTLPRLRAIISNAQPSVALTTSAVLSNIESLFMQLPNCRRCAGWPPTRLPTVWRRNGETRR